MKNSQLMLSHAIAGVIALAVGGTAVAADVVCAERERCYGVAKAGNNDCATSNSVCAGTAKQDNQKDAWVYTPKGTCEKLSGGTLKPPATAKN